MLKDTSREEGGQMEVITSLDKNFSKGIHLQSRSCMFNPWVRKIHQEEGMATHASILAWRIPWTEEPDGILSIGLERVKHD